MSSTTPSSLLTSSQQVYLPPARLSDFVIHFRDTDFHVHKLVLQHHSAYFRAIFDTFPPLSDVVIEDVSGRERKRQRNNENTVVEVGDPSPIAASSTVSPTSSSAACDHSELIHCVHLPDRVGRESCSEEEFLLFLPHLYFCDVLCCPPFYPPTEKLDGLSVATPLCLTPLPGACSAVYGRHAHVGCVGHYVDALDSMNMWLPAVITAVKEKHWYVHYVGWHVKWDEWLPSSSHRLAPLCCHWDGNTALLRIRAEVDLIPPRPFDTTVQCTCQHFHAYCRPLLSLFDYFDCPAMLQRCDVIMAAEVPVRVLVAHIAQLVERLEDALTYRLSCTRERCLAAIRAIPQDQAEAALDSWARLPPAVLRCIQEARGQP